MESANIIKKTENLYFFEGVMLEDTVFIGAAIFFVLGGLLWVAAMRVSNSALSVRQKQIWISLIVIAVAGVAIAVIDRHASEYKANYVQSENK